MFDPAKLAELVDEEARIAGAIQELAVKLNDQHATDGTWDDARSAQYTADQQKHGQLTRELKTIRDAISMMRLEEPEQALRNSTSALSRWLRGGENNLSEDEREAHLGEIIDGTLPDGGGITFRVQAATRSDDATGIESVQEVIPPRIIDRLSHYGGVSRMAQQFVTGTGGDYRQMQMDAASQEGEILDDQNTAVSAQDLPAIGIINFLSRTASSRPIILTREMLQDSVFDIQGYAERQALRRMGRIWNKAFTLGTNDGAAAGGAGSAGANRSEGVVHVAKAGLTAAAAAAFTWPEITNLIYTINRAYRGSTGEEGEGGFNPEMAGVLGYMISDGAEQKARILTDGDNRPLWVPSTREGLPNTLNAYPYVVNGNMAAPAAGTVPMLFGNFSYYGIRTVAMVEIFRFMDSRTMQRNTIEILAFSRRDGRAMGAVDGGKCEAFSKLTMHA